MKLKELSPEGTDGVGWENSTLYIRLKVCYLHLTAQMISFQVIDPVCNHNYFTPQDLQTFREDDNSSHGAAPSNSGIKKIVETRSQTR